MNQYFSFQYNLGRGFFVTTENTITGLQAVSEENIWFLRFKNGNCYDSNIFFHDKKLTILINFCNFVMLQSNIRQILNFTQKLFLNTM